jgi:hypothetical protein
MWWENREAGHTRSTHTDQHRLARRDHRTNLIITEFTVIDHRSQFFFGDSIGKYVMINGSTLCRPQRLRRSWKLTFPLASSVFSRRSGGAFLKHGCRLFRNKRSECLKMRSKVGFPDWDLCLYFFENGCVVLAEQPSSSTHGVCPLNSLFFLGLGRSPSFWRHRFLIFGFLKTARGWVCPPGMRTAKQGVVVRSQILTVKWGT